MCQALQNDSEKYELPDAGVVDLHDIPVQYERFSEQCLLARSYHASVSMIPTGVLIGGCSRAADSNQV